MANGAVPSGFRPEKAHPSISPRQATSAPSSTPAPVVPPATQAAAAAAKVMPTPRAHPAELARRASPPTGDPVASLAPGEDTLTPARASLLAAYLRRVRARIEPLWRWGCARAPRPGSDREATVYVLIDADGSVRTARIVASSGDVVLDQAALTAVQSAGPFVPPPQLLLQSGALGFKFGARVEGRH